MERDGARGITRRGLLGAASAGAAGAVLAPLVGGVAPAVAGPPAPTPPGRPDRFSRLFRLPPFAPQEPRVEAALRELGSPGGLLDAHDRLSAGPEALITDPALSAGNPDNPSQVAGTTFLGQFIDHDITFDTVSRLGRPTAPEATPNARTPALDLDSVYGGGRATHPHLYDPADPVKLLVESGGRFEDLPRTSDGQALLGDPRNDEHVVLAGLHCAFMLFHNRTVDGLRASGSDPAELFAAARRSTVWHYQWVALHEFLPQVVGQAMVDDVLSAGPRVYDPPLDGGSIPVEFQGAAYRMGHSMVRPSYRANFTGNGGQPFFAFIFDPSQEGAPDPDDLRGGVRAPRRFVDWQTFFDFGDGSVRPNKRIDTRISTPLFTLPLGAIASHDPPTALPQRTLLRHLTWSLPSGQAVARELGAPVLGPAAFAELRSSGVGFESSTPLWYYVLKEAEVLAGGLHLGPVGGRIVAEVLLGLLRTDPRSWLVRQPSWTPPSGAGFRMTDFLTAAGVDPTSRSA